MKSATLVTVFAVSIAAVSAQLDISKIPTCAVSCALGSISETGCSPTDLKCICSDTKFIIQLAPCISEACGSADQQKMLELATASCASLGVTIPSDILSSANGTTNGTTNATITTRPDSPSTSTDAATTTSTNGAARMVGGGFVAAAMGAAMLVL